MAVATEYKSEVRPMPREEMAIMVRQMEEKDKNQAKELERVGKMTEKQLEKYCQRRLQRRSNGFRKEINEKLA